MESNAINYVYVHINAETDMPFYIGMGIKNRVRRKGKGRSDDWNKLVKKHGYYYGILKDNLTREQAYFFERDYIIMFRSIGVKLINKNNGGGGPNIENIDDRKKMSERSKKYQMSLTDEDKKKISLFLSNILKGKKKPKRSEDHCKNLSKSNKGQSPWNKGIKCNYSKETRDKMGQSFKKGVIVFDINDNKIGEFESITEASKSLSISLSKASKILNGLVKKSIFKIYLK